MSNTKLPLYQFLSETLIQFLPQEHVSKMLQNDAYKVFEQAFTHPTFNPNFHYQMLEILGDAVCSAAFIIYVFEKFPCITREGDVTILKNYFLNKKHFASLSDKLGFSKYIRLGYNRTPSLDEKEDVFESFVGALQKIGDNFIGEYMGQIIVKRFIFMVFDSMNIEVNNLSKYRSSVQMLKERFFDPKNTQPKWEITKNDQIFTALSVYQSKILGRGTGNDVKEAQENAAHDALQNEKLL